MPCHVVKFPGGATAIVKTASPRPRRCMLCRAKVHDYVLCDFVEQPAQKAADAPGRLIGALNPATDVPAKTCDQALCRRCAVHVDPDLDYCPLHAAALNIGGRRLRL